MPHIIFHEPYYTSCVRDYVASQMPTGERVSLVSDDGEFIATVNEPREYWGRELALAAQRFGYEYTQSEIESFDTEEFFS